MVRARSKATTAARKKRTRKLTKGFRLSRHNLYRQSIVTLIRARVFAFRDRKAKKRQYRRLWIVRINAACRMRGIRYSEFIHGLQLSMIALDRLYARHLSLGRDLRILGATILTLVFRQPVAVDRATGRLSLRRRPRVDAPAPVPDPVAPEVQPPTPALADASAEGPP